MVDMPQRPVGSKGKPPHRPAGKAWTSEENRYVNKMEGLPNPPPEKELKEGPARSATEQGGSAAPDGPTPSARSAHDQPPGGFRRGVAHRYAFERADEEEEG